MTKRGRGQLQLSFGMIFSIIIIIATISIAFYFIQKILTNQECTTLQLFKTDLQDSIDKIWRSPFGQELFSSKIPGGITKVCIGNPTLAPAMYSKVLEDLDPYLDPNENLMFYPAKEACKGQFVATKLTHLKSDSFVCFDVVGGKVSFNVFKQTSTDTLVSVKK